MSEQTRRVTVCSLGRTGYQEGWDLQKQIQARLVEIQRAPEPAGPHPGHVLLLVEHPHVYTLGKSGNEANLLLTEAELAARGAAFYRIDRGGDITYHGPGQIVGYPLLDLHHFFTDIHRYLRQLEEMTIRTLADYGIDGGRVPGRTGVWVGPDARGPERKVCAMGIRCSRWVTMHGFALNAETDLSYFGHIIPCGIDDRGVTSIAAETGRAPVRAEVERRLTKHFAACFGAEMAYLDGPEARAFVAAYIARTAAAAGL